MTESSPFHTVEAHLVAVNEGKISDLDTQLIDSLVSQVSIDKAVVVQNPEATKSLLSTVIDLLNNESLNIDYDKVIEVLGAFVSQLDFEYITSSIFSFNDLLEALRSPNTNLQILSLKVAKRADPLDIIANTEIIPLEVEFLSNPETSIRLVNEIEDSLSIFLHSQLIRRRVLSDHVLEDLEKMANTKNVVVKTRLFDFMVRLLSFVQEHEVPSTLYVFDDFIREDGDVMYTLNLIKFYNDLVDLVGESLNKKWILDKIKTQLFKIGELYLKRSEITDIEFVAVSAISQLFKSLSFTDPDLFHQIDSQYINLSKKDELLLSNLNPGYLATHHIELIQQLPLSIDNVLVYRNLIKNEDSFNIIKPRITTPALLRLPYLELVAVLEILTRYSYGSEYLLTELPQVMNKLLKGDHVIEPETFQLRKRVLENLNSLSNEELRVWKGPVHHEYRLIVNGASNPGLAAPLTL